MMKKLLAILLTTVMATGVVMAKDVVFVAGTGNDTGATSVTKDGITVTMSHMDYSNYYVVLALTDMVVEAEDALITNIEFTCTHYNYGATYFHEYAPDGYSYDQDGITGRWEGLAQSVTLKPTAQVRMTRIAVTADETTTAVRDINNRQVVATTYCDLAGRTSQKPFEGLNIVVNRYADGTTSTSKVVF